MKLIAFDLEGPLSPNDHAYELMSLTPQGQRLFELLSRYDDQLTLEGRTDYEPGDTLRLILPFLLSHGRKDKDIEHLAHQARLTQGAGELISHLQDTGWRVLCITTSYEPYALSLTQRLGILPTDVASTPLSLDHLRPRLRSDDLDWLKQAEVVLLALSEDEEMPMKEKLDCFFWQQLPPPLAAILDEVRPTGGWRKVEALKRLAPGTPFSQVVVVGDSITDSRILQAVDEAGGLSIAFNANEYALPYATLGLASTSILDLAPMLDAWAAQGRAGVKAKVGPGQGDRAHFHWLKEGELPLDQHFRFRRLLRAQAAELG